MTLPSKIIFDPKFPIVDKDGRPTQTFRDYVFALDRLVGAMAAGNLTAALVSAANDGAAAAGGVAIGQMYRNGSQLMVRVV